MFHRSCVGVSKQNEKQILKIIFFIFFDFNTLEFVIVRKLQGTWTVDLKYQGAIFVFTCSDRRRHHNPQQHTAGHAEQLHPDNSASFPWKPPAARSWWWDHRTPRLRGLRCHRTLRERFVTEYQHGFLHSLWGNSAYCLQIAKRQSSKIKEIR